MVFLGISKAWDCQANELGKVQLHGHLDFLWRVSLIDIFTLSRSRKALNSFIQYSLSFGKLDASGNFLNFIFFKRQIQSLAGNVKITNKKFLAVKSSHLWLIRPRVRGNREVKIDLFFTLYPSVLFVFFPLTCIPLKKKMFLLSLCSLFSYCL